MELIAYSGGNPCPVLPTPFAGYARQIEKAVADARPVQPAALLQNVSRQIPLIHEPQRFVIRRFDADCQPVIAGDPQSRQFPVCFQGNVRHPGKTADGFRLRKISVYQPRNLHQPVIYQHERIRPGQESPGYLSSHKAVHLLCLFQVRFYILHR